MPLDVFFYLTLLVFPTYIDNGQYNIISIISLQYMTYLTQLNSSVIGITGWKLFNVNRSSIKMVSFILDLIHM